MQLSHEDRLAQDVTQAIKTGDVESLQALLTAHSSLAASQIVIPKGQPCAGERTLLHVATDWPGHFPRVGETIAILLAAGANSSLPGGLGTETPLHWAASSNDVAALDALLDGGADIEAMGAAIGGGTALADAVAFGNWNCARRLIERGAKIHELWQAAGLGRMDLVEHLAAGAPPDLLTGALWCACWGGQREAAGYLLDRGANPNWIGWDKKTPLDAATTGAGSALVPWLRERGAKTRKELAA